MKDNRIEVVTPDEAEAADYYVCTAMTNPLAFPDNMIDECCKCGKAIQHRPHYPVGVKKICMACVMPDMERDAKKGELTIQITPKTAREVAEYLHKKNSN